MVVSAVVVAVEVAVFFALVAFSGEHVLMVAIVVGQENIACTLSRAVIEGMLVADAVSGLRALSNTTAITLVSLIVA